MRELGEDPGVNRLEELALFVTAEAVTNRSFTRSNLNDIIFLLDALSHAELGHSLTGMNYQKLPDGPALRDVSLEDLTSDLTSLVFAPYPDSREEVMVALRAPDMDVFTETERALIERVVNTLKNSPRDEVSYCTHQWMSRYHALPLWGNVPLDEPLLAI